MSTLVAQTISNGTVSTSSANVIQGSAKAWVNWAGASGTRNSSYNVSSVTRTAQGTYTINFTNAFANANYTYVGMSIFNSSTRLQVVSQDYRTTNTTSALYVVTGYAGADTSAGFLADVTTACVAVFA